MAGTTGDEIDMSGSTDQFGQSRRERYRVAWKQFREEWYIHVSLIGVLALVAFPLVTMIMMSTQSLAQIQTNQLTFGSQLFENYSAALFERNFISYMTTSFIMATLIAVGKVLLALLAAMALVYYDFPFQRLLLIGILLTLLLPIPLLIVPLFQMLSELSAIHPMLGPGTMFALVVPFLASPTALLLLYQHFRSIPDSYLETAKLDDIGPIRFLVYVLIPMSKNMLVGLFVISFIWAWNQYLWPLVVDASGGDTVIQIGLQGLMGNAAGETPWGIITAGTVLALIPPVVLLILLRKQLLTTFNLQTK
ncbi:carbohydrate ABC transporter permease [Halovenus sp. HT40]|uniref:carbohydrate ABC transporter permease n=1 Tax=Halovenus sp. HT40 TaxID=3126691 RepID=UPI00300ECB97